VSYRNIFKRHAEEFRCGRIRLSDEFLSDLARSLALEGQPMILELSCSQTRMSSIISLLEASMQRQV
jgi:hypothetical protein